MQTTRGLFSLDLIHLSYWHQSSLTEPAFTKQWHEGQVEGLWVLPIIEHPSSSHLRCFGLVSNFFQLSCKGFERCLRNLLSTQCTKCVHSQTVFNSEHQNAQHHCSLLSAVQLEGKWLDRYVRLWLKCLSQVFKLHVLKRVSSVW